MVAKKKKTVKRKVIRKKIQEDPTYVRIENAKTFRKSLLRTAIEAGTLLKHVESYKILKELKMKEIKNLHAIMGEIEKEFRKFKTELPKIKEEEKVETLKSVEQPEKRKIAHLSGLDAELEEIKQKLAELNL
jgi:hypothetical protein